MSACVGVDTAWRAGGNGFGVGGPSMGGVDFEASGYNVCIR